MTDKKKMEKLEDNVLWREACNIAEAVYDVLDDIPEDEKWSTTPKLRSAANDMMLHVSQALSCTAPGVGVYDWSNAARAAGSLKTMYRFAGRQKFIDLDPEIMVRLDSLILKIQKESTIALSESKTSEERDIEHWRKKYKIWKAMQE